MENVLYRISYQFQNYYNAGDGVGFDVRIAAIEGTGFATWPQNTNGDGSGYKNFKAGQPYIRYSRDVFGKLG